MTTVRNTARSGDLRTVGWEPQGSGARILLATPRYAAASPPEPWHHPGMKIYTRKGDDGSTGLYGGDRVQKSHPRVETYGLVDELNAVLGWVRATELPPRVDETLALCQEACFRLGAHLATVENKDPGVQPVGDDDIVLLETSIDRAEENLEPLKTFVLPGGTEAAARLHIARTVCRRAERALVGLREHETAHTNELRWLNRMSDMLFVQARLVNHHAGEKDIPWLPTKQ